ncbi:MAG: heparinase II/III-family protein, partial [Pyrinomonadaceae bacterium]|nr:heparinase II/III-family protein [Pyrinomonadaceae bacterium]
WAATDNYMIVDAGEIGSLNGGHGHADTLSFELAAGGRPILVDSGTYTYNESKDLRDYFRSSEAHNTLTIDEKSSSEAGGKFSWETKAVPSVKNWLSEDRFDFFEGSHDGYQRLENSPATHTRSILFLKNDYWIMRDFVETAGKHSYKQNFNFDRKTRPEIRNLNGLDYVSETNSQGFGLELFTFGDNGNWRIKDGWVSNCYGDRDKAPLVQYVSKGVGPQEFFTFMVPNEKGFEKPEVIETTVEGGRAFVVNYRNYSDLFVFADGDGQIIRTEFFNTDFRFLWARMSPDDRLPEEFVLINGSNFSLDGRVVVQDPKGLDYAIARRFGDKLYVRTPKNVFNVSLPKNQSNTYILKTDMEE